MERKQLSFYRQVTTTGRATGTETTAMTETGTQQVNPAEQQICESLNPLEFLAEASALFQRTDHIFTLLKESKPLIHSIFPFSRMVFIQWQEIDKVFQIVFHSGWTDQEMQTVLAGALSETPGRMLRNEIPANKPLLLTNRTQSLGGFSFSGSQLVIPVQHKHRFLGAILLETEETFNSNPHTLTSLQLYAGQLAAAIEFSDHAQAMEALQLKHVDLIEYADLPAFTIDPEGVLQDVSEGFVHLLECPDQAQALQTSVSDWLLTAHPDETLPRLLKRNGFYKNLELQIQKQDGSRVQTLLTLYPIAYEKKRIGLYQGILKDISEKRELESQLLQAQRIGVLGTLASGIAHDFNNLITGIMGCASLVLSEIDQEHPSYEDMQTIMRTSLRASELTKQLLSIRHEQKAGKSPVDLTGLLRDIHKLLYRTTDKSIEIKTHFDSENLIVEGNATRIQQTLLNVALNGRDAMPGGGQLCLTAEKKQLEVVPNGAPLTMKPGPVCCVTISDTGIGMDEETLSHIFEPFYTTKGSKKGNGLGLAIAAEVMRSHGGMIQVDSRIGSGTTFTLYFPLSQCQEMEKPIPVAEIPIPKGNEIILLVDDEEVIRRTGKRILESFGYHVFLAADGLEAIEAYQREDRIDLVLMDIMMPGMNGRETIKKIRSINPDVRALLLSGSPGEQSDSLDRTPGFQGFIAKPFSTDHLLGTIRATLNA